MFSWLASCCCRLFFYTWHNDCVGGDVADGLPGQRRSMGGDAPGRSLRTFLALPLGHGCSGGWRLELRQQLGSAVTVDAKLQGMWLYLPLLSRACSRHECNQRTVGLPRTSGTLAGAPWHMSKHVATAVSHACLGAAPQHVEEPSWLQPGLLEGGRAVQGVGPG